MAKCKGCGADIIWIKMKTGKAMPCDPEKVPFNNTWPAGGLTLITPEGKIAKGEMDLSSDTYGYVSHFATCPVANKFRKERDNAKEDS